MFDAAKLAIAPYLVWIKVGIAVAALAAAGYAGYSLKGMACALAATTEENSRLTELVGAYNHERERAEELQRRLDALPKSEDRIREVVRENPAVCDRPVPVADSLREAIRAANAARAMPADS